MSKNLPTLPAFAKVVAEPTEEAGARIDIDGPKAYAYWLELLRAKHGEDAVTLDQYWLEVAHQCMKLDVQLAIAGSALDPRASGKALVMSISRSPEHAQAGKPAGRGAVRASKGLEARAHYSAIRGAAALVAATA